MDENQLREEVLASLRRIPSLRQSYDSYREFLLGFYHAVAWRDEPWLMAWLGVLLGLLTAVVAFRRSVSVEVALFAVLSVLVLSAERLNSALHERWRDFATQDYFDKRGVFASMVYAGPLLVILFVQLVVVLREAAGLMVKVKRLEMRDKVLRRVKEEKAANGNGNGKGGKED